MLKNLFFLHFLPNYNWVVSYYKINVIFLVGDPIFGSICFIDKLYPASSFLNSRIEKSFLIYYMIQYYINISYILTLPPTLLPIPIRVSNWSLFLLKNNYSIHTIIILGFCGLKNSIKISTNFRLKCRF